MFKLQQKDLGRNARGLNRRIRNAMNDHFLDRIRSKRASRPLWRRATDLLLVGEIASLIAIVVDHYGLPAFIGTLCFWVIFDALWILARYLFLREKRIRRIL